MAVTGAGDAVGDSQGEGVTGGSSGTGNLVNNPT